MRRCVSHSDLAYRRPLEKTKEPVEAGPELSVPDDDKPLKRSRSDQSLPGRLQHVAIISSCQAFPQGASGHYKGDNSQSRTSQGLPRGQRAPPVVPRDVGSSTSSPLNLDLVSPRSASQQYLLEKASSTAVAATPASVSCLTTAARPYSPSARSQQCPLSLNKKDLVSASGKRSYVALYSLVNVSSAASLTQAQLTSGGGSTLARTASDVSVSSEGGQIYLASLQQTVPPLPPYNPAPLFPLGPPSLTPAAKVLGSSGEASSSCCANSSSILQQKQLVFDVPIAPATSSSSFAQGASQGLGKPNYGRVIPSISSAESITSVEAGEHLMGFDCGVAGVSSGTLQPMLCNAAAGAATRNAGAIDVDKVQQHLQNIVSGKQQCKFSEATAADGALGEGLAAAGLSLVAAGTGGDMDADGHLNSNISPRQSCSRHHVSTVQPLSPQQHQQHSTHPRLSRSSMQRPGALLELQTVLGREGEQLLLPEYSTRVIDPCSPGSVMHQVQTAAAATEGVLAPPSGLRGNSSASIPPVAETTPTVSELQLLNNEIGQPGSSNQHQGADGTAKSAFAAQTAVTAATAHPADDVLEQPARSVPATVSTALPAVNHTAISLVLGNSRTAAFAAPSMPAFGFKLATAAAGPTVGVYGGQGAAGAAAAAAAVKAFAPGLSTAFASQHAASNECSSSNNQTALSSLSWHMSAGNPAMASPALITHAGGQGRMSPLTAGRTSSAQSPARSGEGGCSQNRRPASFDCSQPLGSRRRGSLELNMPWRSKLDAVIAQVTADALDTQLLPQQQLARSAVLETPVNTTTATITTAGGSEDDDARYDDTFGLFAESPDIVLRHGSRGLLQGLGSGMLLPLLESDQEQQTAGAEAEAECKGPLSKPCEPPSSDLQPAASRVDTDNPNSGASSGTSITSAAGSPLGGDIGAPDLHRGTTGSLSDLETARSYGLEFDGAVVLQSVELGSTRAQWSEEIELLAGVQQHQAEEQEEEDLEGHVTDKLLSLDSVGQAFGLSPQEKQQLADLGSSPVESRLRLGAASRKQPQDVTSSAQQTTAAVCDSPCMEHQSRSIIQQQLHQSEQLQSSSLQQLPGVADMVQHLAPAASADLAHELARATSLGSSISSSISTRSSAGLYDCGGAGSSSSSAAYELFVRLNRARQTLDFAKRQAEMFAELDCAELGVWEALDVLNSMREYEAVLLSGVRGGGRTSSSSGGEYGSGANVLRNSFSDGGVTPDMSLKEHALQVAELCRLTFPDKPWMALVGLMHGLGKLLAHPIWGSQPQWAVAGESYPVGCKFAPQISHSEFFSANPDRRRRTYSASLGIYSAGCGLRNVYMSWGAPEYMYMLLVLNQTNLPEEALFMIRYQRCLALTRPGGAYRQLMSDMDKSMLPALAAFQGLLAFRRVQLPPAALKGDELIAYYNKLIGQYLGEEKLFW